MVVSLIDMAINFDKLLTCIPTQSKNGRTVCFKVWDFSFWLGLAIFWSCQPWYLAQILIQTRTEQIPCRLVIFQSCLPWCLFKMFTEFQTLLYNYKAESTKLLHTDHWRGCLHSLCLDAVDLHVPVAEAYCDNAMTSS
jgi:hypothetical protein